MARPSGGYVARYTAPTATVAKGVWTLRDSFNAQRSSAWPGVFAPIPVMTSATAPSGTVSDSGILSAGTPSWHAFNKATVSGDTTFYASPSPAINNWIQYDYGFLVTINGYQITSRQLNPYGSTQAPASWTFAGSADGSSFTTVDTRTSITWNGAGEQKSFALSQARRFRYWRWTWTSTPSGSAVVLPKIQLTA